MNKIEFDIKKIKNIELELVSRSTNKKVHSYMLYLYDVNNQTEVSCLNGEIITISLLHGKYRKNGQYHEYPIISHCFTTSYLKDTLKYAEYVQGILTDIYHSNYGNDGNQYKLHERQMLDLFNSNDYTGNVKFTVDNQEFNYKIEL